MPRNQRRSAISAIRTIHLEIRTILPILSILCFVFGLERPSNYDDDKSYVNDKDASYEITTNYLIFNDNNKIDVTEENRNNFWTNEESKEKYFWLRKRKREKKLWKDRKEIDKSGSTILIPTNAFGRTIEDKYFESIDSKIRTRRKIREREKRNNEKSTRSKVDRNSNNSMTEEWTSRNRRNEARSEDTKSERFGVRGRRSSWNLRGVRIKRKSIRENFNGLPRGKTFFSLNELDDLPPSEKERERNFSFTLKDVKGSNSSILGRNEFRLFRKSKDHGEIRKILDKYDERSTERKYHDDEENEDINDNEEFTVLREDLNFNKSIKRAEMKERSRWRDRNRKKNISLTSNDRRKSNSSIFEGGKYRLFEGPKVTDERKVVKKNENTFYRKLKQQMELDGNEEEVNKDSGKKKMNFKKYVRSLIRRDRRDVDNFLEGATVPYLTKGTMKLSRKVEEESSVMVSKRKEVPKDSIRLWYEDNAKLKEGNAIEIRSRKETKNKEFGTMWKGIRRRLSIADKKKKEREEAYFDLKPSDNVRSDVLDVKQGKSRRDMGKVINEMRSNEEKSSKLTGLFDDLNVRSRNYSKVEHYNDSFSHEVKNVRMKELRNESLDLKQEEKTVLLRPPINSMGEEETVKIVPLSFNRDEERKEKEGTSGIMNVSKDSSVSWNSTYRKYDTFDSDRINSTRMSILENSGPADSSKDFDRNVRDPVENFLDPRSLDNSHSHFRKYRKRGELKENPRSDWKRQEKNEERRHYEKKIRSKDFQRNLSVKDEGPVENTTISFNDFLGLTPLKFSMVTLEEKNGTLKTKNREISSYKMEVKTTKLPIIENKFILNFSTSSKDISDDIKGRRKQENHFNVERLKEIVGGSIESNTMFSKKKSFESSELIGSSSNRTIDFSRNSNRSERDDIDPVTISQGNFETYWHRGNSMETTDISMSENSERTSRIPSSFSDRSISNVEIEGITSPLPDVSPQWIDNSPKMKFPSGWIDTIATASIMENVLDKEYENISSAVSEWTTVIWEETTIANVSMKQSISVIHNSSITDQWPVKHSAVVEGDLVLGGLMMVHEREDSITCGPVMPQGGVQALEAMLYTLDTLNQQEIVPGVKIGAHILDDCDKDTYGLEMAVDFIKGSISNIDGAEYHCNKTTVRKVISGVVGAASSVTSIQVANLLRLFRIPQVSFFSTSPELSNKQRFEYFTRTIPSDHYQVKAMVDIVLKMGWSYVSIIYEESNYGIKAFEELEELLTKNDICIAVKEKLVKDSGVAEETAYDNIVLKLLTKPRAKGCIIFGSDQEVAGVMRAVRRCNATGAFSWIGSDGWSARGLVSNGNEAEVEGTLSVQPQANPVGGFEEYFLNLTVENNRRNPWFVEFWEDHFQCRYPNSSLTPYNKKYKNVCNTQERLTKENTVFEDQLQFVSDAVMAFAYAFRDMHKDYCGNKVGLCDEMKPTKGVQLLKYLRKVDFKGLSGDEFRFDKNGDGPARYNIIHFKQTEPGVYKWIRVGKYLEGVLHLNMSMVQFKLGHNQTPESVCSLPCEVGQAKKYVEGESCCWHCFNCSQYQIRHPNDETQCKNCEQGTVPDETHSTCSKIPEEFLRLESGWAIGAMSFSSVGILVTLFVCGVFLKHNDTPVVRASGRELSYVLLTGILLCYLVTFALVLRPTNLVCSIQRFGAGFCFTVVYAALLTKTNRISRIFNAGKHSAKRPSFISPRSQLFICSGLVAVQILINGVWIVIDPAKAMHHYPTKEDNLLVCNSYIDASYMIAFAYPIMLIVVCTIYAVLTRKIPEAFNESKYIGFTMYTTCVIWLAFVPLYFGTGNHVALRITSMSVTISLSATVTIACLFTPKLYIILIRPERNVRQNIMPSRPYNTTKSSAVTGTNASSMMAPVTLTAVTCDQNKAVKKHIKTMDCSTQSEYYELELKERKNGKSAPTFVSRATQTQSNNNEKETNDGVHRIDKESKENATTTRQTNNTKIGNGPVNQKDVTL
ncbi:uncharacterized protein LOC124954133 isoform X1 [Vespa velutina]|uniref:uncharacterized protein LOC124954133 isoform X1 n=1 Tax=Vespa velutina TaxID=202808 RepID=UPI001FB249F9|nr:uncharacterized protein LOC124954133 isoform X1 [Vespa velutina]XP_047362537.1 uncharacterized protein LOC124954133 isoform X1 [Vespa velutina]